MHPIYLVYAKTPSAIARLKEEGALQFSSDTFLWSEDPASPTRTVQGKDIMVSDCTVLDLFSPDTPNDLRYDHPQKKEIKSLFSELHSVAANWTKHYAQE